MVLFVESKQRFCSGIIQDFGKGVVGARIQSVIEELAHGLHVHRAEDCIEGDVGEGSFVFQQKTNQVIPFVPKGSLEAFLEFLVAPERFIEEEFHHAVESSLNGEFQGGLEPLHLAVFYAKGLLGSDVRE